MRENRHIFISFCQTKEGLCGKGRRSFETYTPLFSAPSMLYNPGVADMACSTCGVRRAEMNSTLFVTKVLKWRASPFFRIFTSGFSGVRMSIWRKEEISRTSAVPNSECDMSYDMNSTLFRHERAEATRFAVLQDLQRR